MERETESERREEVTEAKRQVGMKGRAMLKSDCWISVLGFSPASEKQNRAIVAPEMVFGHHNI